MALAMYSTRSRSHWRSIQKNCLTRQRALLLEPLKRRTRELSTKAMFALSFIQSNDEIVLITMIMS